MERFDILVGDLARSDAEAVVTSANATRPGSTGVDAAIHRAAGPELLAACQILGVCPVGQAQATPGFGLRASWVLHTAAPVWQGGGLGEPALLAACYRSCLLLAEEKGIRQVDFPSLATGLCRYPLPLAATVALRAVMDHLSTHDLPRQVRLVCADPATAAVYRQTWNLWYAADKDHRK